MSATTKFRVGDKIRVTYGGVTSEGVVGSVDADGDPRSVDGEPIGPYFLRAKEVEGSAMVERLDRPLPTEPGVYISAAMRETPWLARVLQLSPTGGWRGESGGPGDVSSTAKLLHDEDGLVRLAPLGAS
ncbi:hypothetical protein EDD28_0043 [Salana multivorans]|uniref:Uncharacterized protein n=1 Tax=Salana multivorans TaxID=120377 RepID=A0A3N2D6T3_9MICO|nr:hypothetical protein [Salana multivorans]ROR95490.1 hypothetical protein EDD28_0043 [Salana multivorans]